MQPRSRSFTVAFVGARDNYQVPLAMHESKMLSELVTDFYAPSAILSDPTGVMKRLQARQHPDLPSSKVRSSARAIELLHLRPALLKAVGGGHNWRETSGEVQTIISRAALRVAQSSNSHLLLYAGYAYEAFIDIRSSAMKKILFMYHPHIQLSSEILINDSSRHPNLTESVASLQEDLKDRTNETELKLADLVICASTFTARSIEHIGVPSEKIRVVPYGIEAQTTTALAGAGPRNQSDICEFLFVGSGIQRKGLHLLLRAWKSAKPQKARLTVVSRNIHKEIAALLDAPNVRYIPGTAQKNIEELYRNSDIFVMPSLVEGFGYVYLEALSHGCFCIGTQNTGLPDLHLPESAANVISAGDVETLSAALSHAAHRRRLGLIDRAEIMKTVAPHNWRQFRLKLAKICGQLLN